MRLTILLAAAQLISVAQGILDQGLADPAQVCRVVLCITLLQPDANTILSNRHEFNMLMSSLGRHIQRTGAGYYSIDTLSFCLNLCDKLNARMRGFIPEDLVRVLDRVIQSSSGPTFVVTPPAVIWSESKKSPNMTGPVVPTPPPLR